MCLSSGCPSYSGNRDSGQDFLAHLLTPQQVGKKILPTGSRRSGLKIISNHVCLTVYCLRDDAVYDELHKAEGDGKPLPVDEDLPGMGQYYCLHCDRYFADVTVRDEHFKTKKHRRRVKQMTGPAPHTQLDAELAAGMGMPDNGPKLMLM
ncbi:zinc finger (C2H2 type) family protein [Abeliophyllum distichum]|uniref:Zinc finger (C2H2 type) family protein n=1 Tax=Abeliophyllum distichum TaxID=126358 RepID=A0ABD1QZS8_9LAMI